MRTLIRGLLPALMLALLPLAAPASVVVGISVDFAPPPLPVYVQPEIPAPGYIWTPGYWAWGPGGYYWVPGTWVLPPTIGFLWTPGYWGWAGGAYFWHAGYWGPHVGFYGGINYGCGYYGAGYEGGYWQGNHFLYNSTVNNVHNISVTNVYTRTVVNTAPVSRASFNGGAGGTMARPSPAELSAVHERHVGFTGAQREHESLARSDNALRASVNGGRPPIAATSHPAVFTGRGVVPAHAPQGGSEHLSAPYAGNPQHAAPMSSGAGAPSGHAPYTANTQYSGHAGYAGNPQYAARVPSGGGERAPYPGNPQHAAPMSSGASTPSGRVPYTANTQYSGHAGYAGNPQHAAPTPSGAGAVYAGHAPYTSNTQYPGHASSAGIPQYSVHAPSGGAAYAGHPPSMGQPGAYPAHAPAPGQPAHPGGHEPHGEAPGRR